MVRKEIKPTGIMQIIRINKTRLDLLQELPRGSVGAELGVFKGDFTASILSIVSPSLLYLVDLFEGMSSSGDANGDNVISLDMSKVMPALESQFSGSRAKVVKQDSVSWLLSKNEELDWVYIDTDHQYENTKSELAASRTALRPSGIITGHDYCPVTPGVIQAVNEFAVSENMNIIVYGGDRVPSFMLTQCSSTNAPNGVKGST